MGSLQVATRGAVVSFAKSYELSGKTHACVLRFHPVWLTVRTQESSFVLRKRCEWISAPLRIRRPRRDERRARASVCTCNLVGAGREHTHSTSQLLTPVPVALLHERKAEPYKRLPLEELRNVSIRARCLVRSSLETESETIDMETNRRETFIRLPCFLEHGVVIDRGTMRSRRARGSTAAARGLQAARDPDAVERLRDPADEAATARGQGRLPACRGCRASSTRQTQGHVRGVDLCPSVEDRHCQ